MKVSELVAKLQNVIEKDGDLNIYIDDMKSPSLELCTTIDSEDIEKYGQQYLFVS